MDGFRHTNRSKHSMCQQVARSPEPPRTCTRTRTGDSIIQLKRQKCPHLNYRRHSHEGGQLAGIGESIIRPYLAAIPSTEKGYCCPHPIIVGHSLLFLTSRGLCSKIGFTHIPSLAFSFCILLNKDAIFSAPLFFSRKQISSKQAFGIRETAKQKKKRKRKEKKIRETTISSPVSFYFPIRELHCSFFFFLSDFGSYR